MLTACSGSGLAAATPTPCDTPNGPAAKCSDGGPTSSGPTATAIVLAGPGLQAPPQTDAASATPVTPTITLTPGPTATPTTTPTITVTPGPSPTPTPDTRPIPEAWKSWPVVPIASNRAKEIYAQGLAKGNNPAVFSVIGDCQSLPDVFMGLYDNPKLYKLWDQYKYLQDAIDHFKGSFSQPRLAAKDGMLPATALSALWANPQQCQSGETPVDCELRVHKPVIAFINMGTNWRADVTTDNFEKNMRIILDKVIAAGTVPVLTAKADNVEGDWRINQVMAKLAYEYDVPFMNFWASAQTLPNGGLDPARKDIYLTVEGWDRFSFVGLETLYSLWNDFKDITP